MRKRLRRIRMWMYVVIGEVLVSVVRVISLLLWRELLADAEEASATRSPDPVDLSSTRDGTKGDLSWN